VATQATKQTKPIYQTFCQKPQKQPDR
jgi:hypothetical protein